MRYLINVMVAGNSFPYFHLWFIQEHSNQNGIIITVEVSREEISIWHGVKGSDFIFNGGASNGEWYSVGLIIV